MILAWMASKNPAWRGVANHQLRAGKVAGFFPHYLRRVLYIQTVVGLGISEPSTVFLR